MEGLGQFLKTQGHATLAKQSPFGRAVFEQITAYRLPVLTQSRKRRKEINRNTMYYGKPLTLK